MKPLNQAVTLLIAVVLMAGCATSEVTERRSYAGGEFVAKPGRIIVYDIAATPEDIEATSAITGRYAVRPNRQTPQERALGRKLGALVSARLVQEILRMGMPAERAGGPAPNIGDIIITGEFVVIDEGDRAKRMLIGFGSGAGKLQTFVEGSQVTPTGFRRLGSATIEAGGGKMPGMAAPLIIMGGIAGNPVSAAVISGGLNIAQELGPEKIESAAKRTAKDIAKVLRDAFRKRGWI